MRISFSYFFCLLAGLLFNCQKVVEESHVKFNSLSRNGYSIRYPDGWQVDSSHAFGSDIFILSGKEDSADLFNENVSVMVQNLPEDTITLDVFVKVSENQIAGLANNHEILKSERLYQRDVEYHRIVFNQKQDLLLLRKEQYYFISNRKAFVLTYSAEIGSAFRFGLIASEIIGSFHLR
ncbi:MAG: PsbP-related protein [Chitinophagaceae bacterium]